VAKQAELFKRRLEFRRTKKNADLMKKCFTDVYNLGMVSEPTMRKVLTTNYER